MILISDPKQTTYDTLGLQNTTLYAGIDPKEKTRLLFKKLVWVPAEMGKYGKGFYCVEETYVTSKMNPKYPDCQIYLRKMDKDFDIE